MPYNTRLVRIHFRVVLSLLCLCTSTASAQQPVLFAWPERIPDISTYGRAEECIGVIENLLRLVERRSLRADTASFRELRAAAKLPLAPEVADVARLCAAGIPLDQLFAHQTLYVREMDNVLKVLLYAGRTTEALAFGDRWLAATPTSDDTMRAVIRSSLATRLAQSRPAHLTEAWAWGKDIDLLTQWQIGFGTLGAIWSVASRLEDTTMTNRIARTMREVTARLPDSVTQSAAWQKPIGGIGQLVLAVLQQDNRSTLLDSLRVSTQAYHRYLAALRTTAKLTSADEPRRAQAVTGESWFPQKPAGPRPTPGVVSVVLTTNDNECAACLSPVALVRRLKDRFPTVEFTLVANTKGYHGLVIEPPTPEREAALIDSMYRKVHGLPATTVVQHTRFWRLPEPDRRRVNESISDMYGDGGRRSTGMYLVDKAGTIVTRGGWSVGEEEEFAARLEAVLQQP